MEDILGADETGINVIPRATHTLAPQGSRQVPGLVKKAMAQITKVTCISLPGILLPYLLIFGGKTSAVFPSEVKPSPGSFYSATPSHFANAFTTLEYVQKIIIPFIHANRLRRIEDGKSTEEEEKKRWAIIIWDNFSAHKDAAVEALLNEHHIKPMYLPPNCTSIYQALDVMFNGNEKQILRSHFSEWHFQTLQLAMARDPNVIDVLPKNVAKKRALIATLIRGVHEIMEKKKDLICRAWAKTGLCDQEPSANVSEEIELDNLLVRDMVRLTLDKDDEAVLMDVDDNFDDVPADAPGAPEEYGIHDIDDTHYEEVDWPDVNDEDVDDDSDFEYIPRPTKRTLQPEHVDAMDDAASDSAETSILVNLTRAELGKSVQVTFQSRTKPSAAQLLQKLKSLNAISEDTTIV